MEVPYDPSLTQPDIAVWKNLQFDIQVYAQKDVGILAKHDYGTTLGFLHSLNNTEDSSFQPTVFTGWGQDDILPFIQEHLICPFTTWATTVVRRPTDVVFLIHIILYSPASVPSAVTLYTYFTWSHAILPWLMQAYYCGPFTLMLHNHIHNNGVLAPEYAIFDSAWPYVLEPLMGHTWDSNYYHHVKHHHLENNGPDDLSSTIRYQRDNLFHFVLFVAQFLILVLDRITIIFSSQGKTLFGFLDCLIGAFFICYDLATDTL